MNPAGAQKLNKDIVGYHFSKYKSVLDRLGIEHKPKSIYNIDGKNCRIFLHHQQEVRQPKRVHQIANEHAESATVCVTLRRELDTARDIYRHRTIKSALTRFKNYLDNFDTSDILELTSRLQQIELLNNVFDDVHMEIDSITGTGKELEIETFENNYLKILSQAQLAHYRSARSTQFWEAYSF
ncbi:hypothetical protein WA026_021754 [Henosepilachna vigintioctopunctata]|uniref:CHAD domain-containing protein n=1 Tax=Henosepilachna vigintioctopunctata TaxID=420089 RepID=A0AAW1TSF0_9CUCU